MKWRAAGPDPELRDAAAQLAQYTDQLLAEPVRRLAAGTTFATWYSRNQETLRSQPYLREANGLAAMQLLPLFERDPHRWAALAYLNAAMPSPGESFSDFLAAWGAASPPDLRPLVAEIRSLFGFEPASAASDATDSSRTQCPRRCTSSGCGS